MWACSPPGADILRESAPIRSLLISADVPSTGHGTGRRLLALRRSLQKLGECRTLWLTNNTDSAENTGADYVAPTKVLVERSRLGWLKAHLTAADYRANAPALSRISEIRRDYPFDLVMCNFFQASGAAPFALAPCLLDVDAMPGPTSPLTHAIYPITLRAMRARAAKFDSVFTIRVSDGRLLAPVKTTLLPASTGVFPSPIKVDEKARNLLFIGPTGWLPNLEAIEYLAENLAPRLAGTGYTLRIIGQGTDKLPPRPQVSYGGYVDDLAAEYRNARLVLCPIWTGGGANIKLAEAVEAGAACVASAHAAAAFETLLEPGRDIAIGRDRQDFLNRVCALMTDSDAIAALRTNAARAAACLSSTRFDAIVEEAARRAVSRVRRPRSDAREQAATDIAE